MNKLTGNERLTLFLSAAALLVSLSSLYFQYFYSNQRVDGAIVDVGMIQGKLSLRTVLVNSGNRAVLIVNAQTVMAEDKSRSISFVGEADTGHALPVLIEPGGVVLVEGQLSSWSFEKIHELAMPKKSTGAFRRKNIGLSFVVIDSKGGRYQAEPLLSSFLLNRYGLESAIISYKPVNLLDSRNREEFSLLGFPRTTGRQGLKNQKGP